MKNILIVLGMHRSGTSVVTQTLKSLDFDLGDNLMSPAESNNSCGFFEDLDIVDINKRVLDSIGHNWFDTNIVTEEQQKFIYSSGYVDEAVSLLKTKMKNRDSFAFKDPRTTKLLPFWRDVVEKLDFEINYLLVIRNPMAVAKSLKQRDGFFAMRSYLLWLSYMITALSNINKEEVATIDYDFFSENTESELKRIAKFYSRNSNESKVIESVNQFHKLQRHHLFSPKDIEDSDTCPQLIKDIYLSLFFEVETGTSHDQDTFKNWMRSWRAEFERLQKVLVYVDGLESNFSSLLSENASLKSLVKSQYELLVNKGII